MREISNTIYLFLIVMIFTIFSFSIESNMDANAIKEYRHNVIGTISVGDGPSKITVNPINGFVYVSNSGSNSVYVIDPSTHRVVEEVAVGDKPTGLAFKAFHNYVYVANPDSDTISVIYTPTNRVVATIPVGDMPVNVLVTPINPETRTFVANFNSNTLSEIDPSTNTVTNTIPLPDCIQPFGLIFNSHDNNIYITCSGSNNVYVMDINGNRVGLINVDNNPLDITVNPFNGYVYVSNQNSDTISVIDSSLLTPLADIININSPTLQGSSPLGITFNPINRYLYVSNFGTATVSVIDSAINEIVDTISVGSHPYGALYNPINGLIYVTNSDSDNVSIISIGDSNACLAYNIQHWDNIEFMITSSDLAEKVKLPVNTELDIKILNDPNKPEDLKHKVLEFLDVPNESKESIKIIDLNYETVCASLPIQKQEIIEDDEKIN
jgi:YVTN family beta-propeller protein